ncbi:ABC transporter substrate-binding protein [Gemmobacter fulvus]|uniref:ABC transporter substrate-binding protein n=1 Tax=Gemmobacter fulvus TaxID=2840474 RepID=A0A975PAN2_9RHOB|nr:ABC transporter substrate-binding protein [Gemmobacter fulvus]MBT9244735.1 ABC transporter substrate-binding protein [Gemmobacter fulvus]MDQ1848735.1 ABC transporter substrate-binding protein [Gemmobacter fulvus]QWK91586.1 ABC transporter substrate-binding protein [Gemmobacter fulvus]
MAHSQFTSPRLTRRVFGTTLLAGAALSVLPRPAQALDLASARALIDKAIADVNKVINSGKAEAGMFRDFEAIFARYADVAAIARSALGPASRSASPGQMKAFTTAYQGYIGRKYGRRFREFIGGRIEVVDAKPLKSYFEVISVAHLQGEAPFDLRWHVSNKSGRDLFFNIIIEGVNMLASEREEVGAMLKKRGGDIDALIADLKSA